MTRNEFIAGYCERSGVTWEWLSEHMDAIPCDCGDETCLGWQMRTKAGIKLDSAIDSRNPSTR